MGEEAAYKDFITADAPRLMDERDNILTKYNKRFKKGEQDCMFLFILTVIFTCILVAFGVTLSVTLHTRRRFKRSKRPWKRAMMRGAIFASPRLDDALFTMKDEHRSFWSADVEYDELYYM
jgi:hypothetical protein